MDLPFATDRYPANHCALLRNQPARDVEEVVWYGAKIPQSPSIRLPPFADWGGAAGLIYRHSLWGSL